MNQFSQSSHYLSVQRAVRGQITPNLRAVNVEYGAEYINLYFYYDQEPSEFETETAEVVATEVFVDFDHIISTMKVIVDKIHLPYPHRIPKKGLLVFYRYEPKIAEQESLIPESLNSNLIEGVSRKNILISVETALLGRITNNLRLVRVEYGTDFIFLYFYYDQEPSELEIKLANAAGEKVAQDFKDVGLKNFKINKIHHPFPMLFPYTGHWVFHRYEHIPEEGEI